MSCNFAFVGAYNLSLSQVHNHVVPSNRRSIAFDQSASRQARSTLSNAVPISKQGDIVVIGSSNTDLVVRSKRLPVPGETILGGQFHTSHGGKGANQAVAAARLGANVTFVAKVGEDNYGTASIEHYKDEKIDCTYITRTKAAPSGIAIIMVDEKKGENMIVVADSANGHVTPEDVDAAKQRIRQADVILLQLEIPLPTVEYAARQAHDLGKFVVLNPAPAAPLNDRLLSYITHITPNETEASSLTGTEVRDDASAAKACQVFHKRGVQNVIITMGGKGSFVSLAGGQEQTLVRPMKVKPVDTVGAGDCFNGALCVALSRGFTLFDAVGFANKAGAISVTRVGAQESFPFAHEM